MKSVSEAVDVGSVAPMPIESTLNSAYVCSLDLVGTCRTARSVADPEPASDGSSQRIVPAGAVVCRTRRVEDAAALRLRDVLRAIRVAERALRAKPNLSGVFVALHGDDEVCTCCG